MRRGGGRDWHIRKSGSKAKREKGYYAQSLYAAAAACAHTALMHMI